jgi:hypothetical protein
MCRSPREILDNEVQALTLDFNKQNLNTTQFWQWCITFRTTELLHSIQHLWCQNTKHKQLFPSPHKTVRRILISWNCQIWEALLLPAFCNTFKQHFEYMALDTANHQPSLWFHYVHDTSVGWPHGPDSYRKCCNYIHITIQFTTATVRTFSTRN